MSEQVVLIVHGKLHEGDSFEKRYLTVEKGENLLFALKRNGYYATDCSGNGTCGKCVVRYVGHVPLPTLNERTVFEAEKLRKGYRLACRHTLLEDTEIILCASAGVRPNVVTDAVGKKNDVAVGSNQFADTVFYTADIGTTTVAMQAVKGNEVLATYAALNPQRRFGADVASRIAAANEGHLQELAEDIRQCMEDGITNLVKQCGLEPEFVVAVGNMTMNYLFRAVSPEVLGRYPFGPVDTEAKQMVLQGKQWYLIPGISAFVGGDVLSGIRVLDMAQSGQIQLLVDLGTNGEIVLNKSGTLFGTATAAGPAFESGVSEPVMGADFIKAVAKLLEEKAVDATGLLQEPYFVNGITVDGILVKQEDIRELQKAKAAIALGIEILCERSGVDINRIETIYLAGGFGYYLSPESAIRIGMFPEHFGGKIQAVGNSALLGAKEFGKLLAEYEPGDRMQVLQHACSKVQAACQSINLAEETGFADKYLEWLSFPERA